MCTSENDLILVQNLNENNFADATVELSNEEPLHIDDALPEELFVEGF